MRISGADLRRVTELLLEHLDELGQEEFEIDKDFYWEVPSSGRYDHYDQPSELSVGQLSEDWAELEAMLSGVKEPIGYGLVWLGSILRAVGEDTQG